MLRAVLARNRLCAVLLILLAFMPCSAPFSTCSLLDITAADKKSTVTCDASFSNVSAIDEASIGGSAEHAITRESAYISDAALPDMVSQVATSSSRSVVMRSSLASATPYLTTTLRI
jgi:hypothetical protein